MNKKELISMETLSYVIVGSYIVLGLIGMLLSYGISEYYIGMVWKGIGWISVIVIPFWFIIVFASPNSMLLCSREAGLVGSWMVVSDLLTENWNSLMSLIMTRPVMYVGLIIIVGFLLVEVCWIVLVSKGLIMKDGNG